MSEERLREGLISLFRLGAKPPKGPGLKLSQEEYEALLERLRALKEEIEANNERLKEVLKEGD